MKKILLTGGSGFIGKNIRESYLASRYEIVSPSHSELDIADTQSVDKFLKKNSFDCILHTAVKPCHRNAKDTSDLLLSNLKMFANFERNKSAFGKFINFGSGAIYDQSSNITDAKESDIFKRIPRDEHGFCKYTVAKLSSELENFIDLNIFGIFGKYEDYSIRFISNAVCKAIFKMPITLRQNRRFSYIDVADTFPILENLIERNCKFNSYNILPPEFVELKSLAETVSTLCGGVEIKISNEGFGLDYYGNCSRLTTEFPDIKFTPMSESISKLISYYKQNLDKIDKKLLEFDK